VFKQAKQRASSFQEAIFDSVLLSGSLSLSFLFRFFSFLLPLSLSLSLSLSLCSLLLNRGENRRVAYLERVFPERERERERGKVISYLALLFLVSTKIFFLFTPRAKGGERRKKEEEKTYQKKNSNLSLTRAKNRFFFFEQTNKRKENKNDETIRAYEGKK